MFLQLRFRNVNVSSSVVVDTKSRSKTSVDNDIGSKLEAFQILFDNFM